MPPLRSARKFQPHIVLDDIFKNQRSIANRTNIVTAVGPPWSRRFSGDSSKKSFNIHHRDLRSCNNPEIIVIDDKNNIPKQRNYVETKDSDAARTRGLPVGIKRKMIDSIDFDCSIKSENCNEPELMIIDDEIKMNKLLLDRESMGTVATLGELTTKSKKKKVANKCQPTLDIENRCTSIVNANNDKMNNIAKIPIDLTAVMKNVVVKKKRGRPAGTKNKKIVATSERTIDKVNCSKFMDVMILDDKTKITKPVIECEAEQAIACSSKTKARPSENDVENLVDAILKRKDDIVQTNGELVSDRHPVWQLIRHELEYQATAQTLRRIAKSTNVYKMLTSQNEKVEAVIPIVKTAESAEITVINETKCDENTARLEHVLEKLSESIECLSNTIKELSKEFHRRWNKTAQNGQ